MLSMLVSVLVLLALGVHKSFCTLERQRERIYTAYPNQILTSAQEIENLQQKSTKVDDKMSCVFACTSEPWCRSVNFKTTPERNGFHICELLSLLHFCDGVNLTQHENYTHYSFEEPGSKNIPLWCKKDPQCKVSVPLGMQSKAIPDSKITASTSYPAIRHLPSQARLHMPNSYGWTPKVNQIGEWLQVDLGGVSVVTGIATQGSQPENIHDWMKSYSLQYSVDGSTFNKYNAGKVFAANVDQNSVVKHVFNPPIHARYIRIYPQTWNNYPSTRMELYGCK